ncbi:hypothetical protein AJ80_03962 [Polytolypa hystricis UAMH7299]|uniref:DUF3955 domain-containing protein n=1 Tax=Polytolypa hystricis (strain UAMH7299) TaxID=1447883 RepID=A0A2B7YEI7_POLH7|nr:hypothetical protein AJ80_03962 [Polytolypa hystricis UAMH7299]
MAATSALVPPSPSNTTANTAGHIVHESDAGPATRDPRQSVQSAFRISQQNKRHDDDITENGTPLIGGITRRTLGIILLLVVVVLWTVSNFLASTIFADNTYSKPYFVTYLNTTTFISPLFPIIGKRLFRLWRAGKLSQIKSLRSLLVEFDAHEKNEESRPFLDADAEDGAENGQRDAEPLLRASSENEGRGDVQEARAGKGKLGFKETAKLSLEFCLLWANYFALGCLQFTTVGSATILTSTSGIWTLIFGTVAGVEKFTARKLLGVLASLIGIIIISRVDLSGKKVSDDDANGRPPSSFPHKTVAEIAIGDAMAAFSAILYGVYTIVMKKQVGDEGRVNMPLFFGLVGLINTVLLWPVFFILHFTGFETFELPGTGRIWTIILVNSISSLVSDILWAYAMLLTTPLVVTVGLSLTIPLSLVAQIFLQGLYSSATYWVGAGIVFFSFLVVNHESM